MLVPKGEMTSTCFSVDAMATHSSRTVVRKIMSEVSSPLSTEIQELSGPVNNHVRIKREVISPIPDSMEDCSSIVQVVDTYASQASNHVAALPNDVTFMGSGRLDINENSVSFGSHEVPRMPTNPASTSTMLDANVLEAIRQFSNGEPNVDLETVVDEWLLLLREAAMNSESQSDSAKLYDCPFCQNSFVNEEHFLPHLRIHFGLKPYRCSHCGKCFTYNSSFAKHKSLHGEVSKSNSLFNGRGSDGILQGASQKFVCDVCCEQFQNSTALRMHSWSHRNASPLLIQPSVSSYRASESSKTHIRAENGPFPLEAMEPQGAEVPLVNTPMSSDASQTPDSSLPVLQRRNEGLYKCPICHKRYTRLYDLKVHSDVHNDVRQFKCGMCNMKFSQKANLANHLRRKHGTSKQCPFCDKMVPISDLKVHVQMCLLNSDNGDELDAGRADKEGNENQSSSNEYFEHLPTDNTNCEKSLRRCARFSQAELRDPSNNNIAETGVETLQELLRCATSSTRGDVNIENFLHGVDANETASNSGNSNISDKLMASGLASSDVNMGNTESNENGSKLRSSDMEVNILTPENVCRQKVACDRSNMDMSQNEDDCATCQRNGNHVGVEATVVQDREAAFVMNLFPLVRKRGRPPGSTKYAQERNLPIITTHSKDKPYQCGICKRCFKTNEHVRRHIRTHTGDKPYHCLYCPKRFSDSGNLSKHRKQHAEYAEQPGNFKCKYCSLHFLRKSMLQNHVAIAHLGNPNQCLTSSHDASKVGSSPLFQSSTRQGITLPTATPRGHHVETLTLTSDLPLVENKDDDTQNLEETPFKETMAHNPEYSAINSRPISDIQSTKLVVKTDVQNLKDVTESSATAKEKAIQNLESMLTSMVKNIQNPTESIPSTVKNLKGVSTSEVLSFERPDIETALEVENIQIPKTFATQEVRNREDSDPMNPLHKSNVENQGTSMTLEDQCLSPTLAISPLRLRGVQTRESITAPPYLVRNTPNVDGILGSCITIPKPFQCSICMRCFRCKEHVKRHMRTHTGEQPYECEHCHRRFADGGNLSKHVKQQHHVKENTVPGHLQCDICGQLFHKQICLEAHTWCHARGGRPFKCEGSPECYHCGNLLKSRQTVQSSNGVTDGKITRVGFNVLELLRQGVSTSPVVEMGQASSRVEVNTEASDTCLSTPNNDSMLDATSGHTSSTSIATDRDMIQLPMDSSVSSSLETNLAEYGKQKESEDARTPSATLPATKFSETCGNNSRFTSACPPQTAIVEQKLESEPLVIRKLSPCSKLSAPAVGGQESGNIHSVVGLSPLPLDTNTRVNCELCGKSCASKSSLCTHRKSHTNDRPYSCSLCGKCYRRKFDLKIHSEVHIVEKPLSCRFCGARFSLYHNLRIHLRNHAKQGSHKCPYCPILFWFKSKMNAHVSMFHPFETNCPSVQPMANDAHNDQPHSMAAGVTEARTKKKWTLGTRYPCPICGRRFMQKAPFVRHLRMHTGERPFECVACQKSFSTKDNLKQHERSVYHAKRHMAKTFRDVDVLQCELCQQKFDDRSSLLTHVRWTHSRRYKHHQRRIQLEFLLNQNLMNISMPSESSEHILPTMTVPQDAGALHFQDSEQALKTESSESLEILGLDYSSDLIPLTRQSRQNMWTKQRTRKRGSKRFKCFCEKHFDLKCTLVAHQRIKHFGLPRFKGWCKKFKRKICGSKYYLSNVDDREDRFGWRCTVCGKSFVRKSSMVAHHTTHFRPFQCTECPLYFCEASHLDNHLQSGHGHENVLPDIVMTTRRVDQKTSVEKYVMSLYCTELDENKEDIAEDDAANEGGELVNGGSSCLKNGNTRHEAKEPDVNAEEIQDGEESVKKQHRKNRGRRRMGKTDKKPLRSHPDRPFHCSMCERRFGSKDHLQRHFRLHTGEKPFVCPYCPKRFASSGNLCTHKKTHFQQDSKDLECDVCGKKFNQKTSLKYHVWTHVKDRPFQCGQCNKSFVTRSTLLNHQWTHRKDEFTVGVTGISAQSTPSSFQTWTADSTQRRKRWCCQTCENYWFPSGIIVPLSANAHSTCGEVRIVPFESYMMSKQHTSASDFPNCGLCGIDLSNTSTPNSQDYRCSICDIIRSSKSKFMSHTLTHSPKTDDRYECHICTKVFCFVNCLEKHFRTHSAVLSESYFKCSHCNRFFSTLSFLSKHDRQCHAEEHRKHCETEASTFAN